MSSIIWLVHAFPNLRYLSILQIRSYNVLLNIICVFWGFREVCHTPTRQLHRQLLPPFAHYLIKKVRPSKQGRWSASQATPAAAQGNICILPPSSRARIYHIEIVESYVSFDFTLSFVLNCCKKCNS